MDSFFIITWSFFYVFINNTDICFYRYCYNYVYMYVYTVVDSHFNVSILW